MATKRKSATLVAAMRALHRVELAVALVAFSSVACTKSEQSKAGGDSPQPSKGAGALRIESSAFANQAEIPEKHTCEGKDVSPPLAWSGAPEGTKSFAVIVDDPDAPDPAAPKRVWVHWVLYNLPPTATSLSEATASAPDGAKDGLNDWGSAGYRGPCPPIGRHRYFHKVYALDTVLGDLGNPKKTDLEAAMKGHVLASGELVGVYQKKK